MKHLLLESRFYNCWNSYPNNPFPEFISQHRHSCAMGDAFSDNLHHSNIYTLLHPPHNFSLGVKRSSFHPRSTCSRRIATSLVIPQAFPVTHSSSTEFTCLCSVQTTTIAACCRFFLLLCRVSSLCAVLLLVGCNST